MMHRKPSGALLVLVLLAALALGGCGGEIERTAEDVRERAGRLRDDAERAGRRAEELGREAVAASRRAGEVSDRVRRRVREVLDDLAQVVPAASRPLPPGALERSDSEIAAYVGQVARSVDAYWTETLTAAGRPEPGVSLVTVPPGRASATGCDVVAAASAAFYCSADDTIYLSETLASEIWRGVNSDFPGQQAGQGRAVGDFGLAYVVAHEYAHNVQHELGLFTLSPGSSSVRDFELQADCMAGLWGNSVYEAGLLQPGDVEEALSTALAAGDFDYDSVDHHGTPGQRRSAWLLGYESGDPSRCRELVN